MDFMLGCNYWDSKSGTDMWINWDEATVEDDLRVLAQNGVEVLRVFPNWRDFQPVKMLYSNKNIKREYVIGEKEECLCQNPSGVDRTMLKRFRRFAEIAKKYNLKLLVSLVTGWMSGRMFTPPALEGKNLITDPEVLMWVNRYIKALVGELKDVDNIIMWDLGNECNCMSSTNDYTQAYVWTAYVSNAIRVADNTRPIASGMHGLSADGGGNVWRMADQGELCDYMTTHPYASPNINNDFEPMNRLRTTIFPTAQSELYSAIGGKPCIIQEQGSFSPTSASDDLAADFIRVNMLSAWANNLTGYLWWCGMEHLKLRKAPYKWSMVERQLGLVDLDKNPKPVAIEMKKFSKVLKTLPRLPQKQIDAVVILPDGERLIRSLSAYTLAKEAGFNITYKAHTDLLPNADYYIVPGINFWDSIYAEAYNFILDRVENYGAKVLFTNSTNGSLTEFERIFGLKSLGNKKGGALHRTLLDGEEIKYYASYEYLLESVGAEVLAKNEQDNIVFSKNKFGKGWVYLINFDLEAYVAGVTFGFDPEVSSKYYKFYEVFGEEIKSSYILNSLDPRIGVTQHKENDDSYIINVVNYSSQDIDFKYTLKDGFELEILYGTLDKIPHCDGLFIRAKKVK